MNELIKKLWYMCTQQNVTQPLKKMEILETLLFATTWIKFEGIIAMRNVDERLIQYDLTHSWNLK